MSITVKEIQKVTVTVPNDTGDYTVGVWVTSDDTGPDPVYIEGEYNLSAFTPTAPLNQVLGDNGYTPL